MTWERNKAFERFEISRDWFVQKALINAHLPSLDVKFYEIDDLKGIEFSVCLPNQKYKFNFFIIYKPAFNYGVQLYQPELYSINTDIVRHIDNHINSQGQICYFFPGDLTYKSGISCLYAIHAAIKWADCYDYWSKNIIGGWPSTEMPHGSYAPFFFNIKRPML